MLIAYFVHNIFVFDNLASYIFFFTILAFINTRGQGGRDLNRRPLMNNDFAWAVDIAAIIVFAYIMWISVLSPYNSSGKLIKAMQEKQRVSVEEKIQEVSVDPKARFKLIKGVLEANDLTRSESRERLVDIAASLIVQTHKTDPAFAKEVYDFVVDQYDKEFKSSKTDPRPYFFYFTFQQKLGMNEAALATIKKASELSPTKQAFLFAEGQILVALNKKDESVVVLKKAYELDTTNTEALKYYIYSLIQNNKTSEVDKILDDHAKLNPGFDKNTMWSDPVVMQALVDAKEFVKAISIAKQRVASNPKDVQAVISLSAVYLKAGDRWSSIEELKKIKLMQPSYADAVDKYIKDIQDGKDPSNQTAN
jgi:tetratricopeptide (TPR) repeat protein